MEHHLFLDIRRLLMNFIILLDKHSIGSGERNEAERIITELNYILKDKEFVDMIEDKIVAEEHSQMSQDLADEILSHGCLSGNCDV